MLSSKHILQKKKKKKMKVVTKRETCQLGSVHILYIIHPKKPRNLQEYRAKVSSRSKVRRFCGSSYSSCYLRFISSRFILYVSEPKNDELNENVKLMIKTVSAPPNYERRYRALGAVWNCHILHLLSLKLQPFTSCYIAKDPTIASSRSADESIFAFQLFIKFIQ